MHIKYSIRLLLIWLLFYSFTANAESENKEATFNSREQAFQTYKTGIEAILQRIPENKDTTNGIELIDAVEMIVYPNAGWGYIDKTNKMYALTSGNTSGLWLLFIDPDSVSLENKHATLTTGKQDQLMAVTIRPDLMTQRWAGIFLVHELTHGFENIYAQINDSTASEYFPYLVELQAYKHLTENKITEILNNHLNSFSIKTHEDLIKRHESGISQIHEVLYSIDKSMNEPEPKSNAEEEMRIGFYLMALSIQLDLNNNTSIEDQIANLNELLELTNIYGPGYNKSSNSDAASSAGS